MKRANAVKGYGQPFYTTLTWPISNMLTAIGRQSSEVPGEPTSMASMDFNDHFASTMSSLRNSALAFLAVFWMYTGNQQYPAYGDAKEFKWKWMKPILARNVLGTAVICGAWEWFLYFSPMKDKLFKYKFSKAYPSRRQMIRDVLMTFQASTLAGFMEIGLCYLWANELGLNTFFNRPLIRIRIIVSPIIGYLNFQEKPFETPYLNIAGAMLVVHLRSAHFWLTHRLMHPWRISYLPDVGRFLYRKVHYLHHKSHNPTAFSGTAMHPVEAFLYYTACLIPVVVGAHPVHAVAYFIDCAVQAWIGHSGFQFPGSGNYFHQLHHRHFDCNYGTPHVPLDGWFGTHASKQAELKTIYEE